MQFLEVYSFNVQVLKILDSKKNKHHTENT